MTLKQKIDSDIKVALRSGKKVRLSCLRMLKSRIQEKEVAQRADKGRDYELVDEEAQQVISAYAKQRRDSIESYEKGGREELAAQERAELEIVCEYLPRQLSPEEIASIVTQAIAESGAESARDLGAVMKIVVPKTKGLADGKVVTSLVREKLG